MTLRPGTASDTVGEDDSRIELEGLRGLLAKKGLMNRTSCYPNEVYAP